MRRRLIIAAIALGVLIIPAVVILFFVDRSPSLQNAINSLANNGTTNQTTNQPVNTNAPAESLDETLITYVAKNFSEIYGNESTENDYANLQDAQAWGSASFNDFLNRTIALNRSTAKPSGYHSLTTSAVVVDITNVTTRTASVTVTTQRTETIDQAVTTFYQKIFLDLVKVGDDWKVNAAAWEAH